jgi:hypothetical protein
MKLTKQQRQHIVTSLVEDFAKMSSNNYYSFDQDGTTFRWISEDGVFCVTRADHTCDYYRASAMDTFVESLTDSQLVNLCQDYWFCTRENLLESIDDELAEAAVAH